MTEAVVVLIRQAEWLGDVERVSPVLCQPRRCQGSGTQGRCCPSVRLGGVSRRKCLHRCPPSGLPSAQDHGWSECEGPNLIIELVVERSVAPGPLGIARPRERGRNTFLSKGEVQHGVGNRPSRRGRWQVPLFRPQTIEHRPDSVVLARQIRQQVIERRRHEPTVAHFGEPGDFDRSRRTCRL